MLMECSPGLFEYARNEGHAGAAGPYSFVRPRRRREDHSSVPTAFCPSAARSGAEGVFSGDPPGGSEATEDGVEHPLPRSEHGGRLSQRGSKLDSLNASILTGSNPTGDQS